MFDVHVGFCINCGSILPPVGLSEYLSCYSCNNILNINDFAKISSKYTIPFNSMENEGFAKKNKNDDVAKGPVIERLCKKCGHDEMSYAAVQLRSADEGQTVFFTCVKCKFTESENS